MALKAKRVLVTGGTGFIGSHLVEHLLNLGAKVIVTYQSIDPLSYFKTAKLDERATMAICDLKDFDRVFSIVSKFEVDFIFHLAAQPLVTVAFDNPRETFETNMMGTVNVLESARLYNKVSGILVTSTDKAYGKIPRASEKNPVGGDHPYESSKAAADLIALSYFATYKLPVVVTRFGNVYGEGDLNFNRILPGIMHSLIRGETLQIRSNGKYVRDYVYVGDVVEVMTILINNIGRVRGEAFNVSSLENLSVLVLIKKVESILGKKIDYQILSIAFGEIPSQSINFNKLRKAFGWKPKSSLTSTIQDISDWYKNYYFDRL